MKVESVLLLLLFWGMSSGQNGEGHRVDATGIERVNVDASHLGRLTVQNSAGPYLEIRYLYEGESRPLTRLLMEEAGSEFNLGSLKTPEVPGGEGKWGAVRDLAAELDLWIPNSVSLHIAGEEVRVDCNGEFATLDIKTSSGNCFLDLRSPFAWVRTQSGLISARIQEGQVVAETTYGQLDIASIPESRDYYRLNSIRGDVVVRARN